MTQWSADELAAMEEPVALADDPDAQQEIAEAESAYAAGDFVTGDDLRARFGLPPYDELGEFDITEEDFDATMAAGEPVKVAGPPGLASLEETTFWQRDEGERAAAGEAAGDGEDGPGLDEAAVRARYGHLLGRRDRA
jgi:hypothetical protein